MAEVLDADDLPTEIVTDAGMLIVELVAAGWAVDLTHQVGSLRLVKDRSRFSVSGPPTEKVKAAGLSCAFDDFAKFHQAVTDWALKPRV